MPPPKVKKQLKSFLGMISFYSSFVPEMRSMRGLLDDLEKKYKFSWTAEHEVAFNKLKTVPQSYLLVTHFRPEVDIMVAADACEYGLGAVISRRFPNGTEKAIEHAVRTLTKAEHNYGQIEKEGLALVFAVRKFHRYLYGRRFTLLTDHKPLLSIFWIKGGSIRSFSKSTANGSFHYSVMISGLSTGRRTTLDKPMHYPDSMPIS